MRKHPVVLGIALLLAIGLVAMALMYGMGLLGSDRRSFSLRETVGIIPVEGVIIDSADLVEQIRVFADDSGIRAVVLRIDSPGGGVAASQEIYQAVCELKKRKKVVASMGAVAASGGYMIAAAADRIVANPGSITGSISTVLHYANVEELMEKIGVRSSVVKSGKFKDIGSPTRKMTAEERALLQAIVDDIYDQFVRLIAENRKLPLQRIVELADGRIFSGRQARDLGLVDELGGLQDAVQLAGRLSGIEGSPDVVHGVKRRTGLLRYLIGGITSAVVEEISGKAAETRGAMYLLQ